MTEPIFVDTNVLVYARDSSEAAKQARAAAWLDRLWRTRRGRLSTQVLHEFYVTVTRKLRPGMDGDAARRDVRSLLAWRPVALAAPLIESAWSVQDRHALSFWDALIVSAAQDAGCRYLLTEDLHAGTRIDDLEIIDPFATAPAELA